MSRVTLLGGGPGLGFYTPALMLRRQLERAGIEADVDVHERYLRPDKISGLLQIKKAFHSNFQVALTAQHMAKDISGNYDPERLETLLQSWRAEDRRYFVLLSGYWMPMIRAYVRCRGPEGMAVHLCHLDADQTPSWKLHSVAGKPFSEVWFLNWERKELLRRMSVDGGPVVPYGARNGRFVIHGGGWGIGDYRTKIAELGRARIPLDVIVYAGPDEVERAPGNRYFQMDPAWRYWERDRNGEFEFPPLGEITNGGPVRYERRRECPPVYFLIRAGEALISKPGAATLIDSLSSATPLILLKPFGAYEEKNGALWKQYGFGIDYEEWKRTGFAREVLAALHDNLLAWREKLTDYGKELIHATQNQRAV